MKILTIENDFVSRNYLRELFSFYGYETLSARNATDGLDIYLAEKPDVLLCNISLPGMSGLEMLTHIRKTDKTTPFILMASQSSEKIAVQAFRLGANDFLKKPVQDNQILPILKAMEIGSATINTPFNYGTVLEGKTVFTFNTEVDAPSNIVRKLIEVIDPNFFDENGIINIELGLTELITNAIEHGNLNISYNEKTIATENNSLEKLMESRINDPCYGNRLVTVTYEYNNDECRWTIADEGDGFDLSKVPDPTKTENLETLHGRGIYFTRFFFDSLQYLGKGNKCVATKKRSFVV